MIDDKWISEGRWVQSGILFSLFVTALTCLKIVAIVAIQECFRCLTQAMMCRLEVPFYLCSIESFLLKNPVSNTRLTVNTFDTVFLLSLANSAGWHAECVWAPLKSCSIRRPLYMQETRLPFGSLLRVPLVQLSRRWTSSSTGKAAVVNFSTDDWKFLISIRRRCFVARRSRYSCWITEKAKQPCSEEKVRHILLFTGFSSTRTIAPHLTSTL